MVEFYDTSDTFLQTVARELELQRQGVVRPEDRFTFRPPRIDYRVEGSGSGSSLTLRLISRSGRVLAAETATGGDLFALEERLAASFARAICRALDPPRVISGSFRGKAEGANNPQTVTNHTWTGTASFARSGTVIRPDGKPWQRFALVSGSVSVTVTAYGPSQATGGGTVQLKPGRGQIVLQLTPAAGQQPLYYGEIGADPSPESAFTLQVTCPGGSFETPWSHTGAWLLVINPPTRRAAPGGILRGSAAHAEQTWEWDLKLG